MKTADCVEAVVEQLEGEAEGWHTLQPGHVAQVYAFIKQQRDIIASLDKRLAEMADTVEGILIGQAQATGIDSFTTSAGTVAVKEEQMISPNPDFWGEIGAEFRQKRLLTSVVQERLEAGDDQMMDWLARGVIRVTPVKKVSFRKARA